MAAQSPLDTRLASLGLLLGAGMLGYSYFRSKQGVGPLVGGGTPNTPTGSGGSSTAAPPSTSGSPLKQLTDWAQQNGLIVTSSFRDTAHNKAVGGAEGSLHTLGRAIDVWVRGLGLEQINALIDDAHARGWNAFFEGKGMTSYGPSTGAHLHVSISPPGSNAK